jgi:hypothetical protein
MEKEVFFKGRLVGHMVGENTIQFIGNKIPKDIMKLLDTSVGVSSRYKGEINEDGTVECTEHIEDVIIVPDDDCLPCGCEEIYGCMCYTRK